MSKIEIYTWDTCPYCRRAKAVLDHLELDYTEYEVSSDREKTMEMVARSGRHTVPQIFVNDQSIGGSDELIELLGNGEFLKLVNAAPAAKQHQHEEISHVA